MFGSKEIIDLQCAQLQKLTWQYSLMLQPVPSGSFIQLPCPLVSSDTVRVCVNSVNGNAREGLVSVVLVVEPN